jgi:hypothetical protein
MGSNPISTIFMKCKTCNFIKIMHGMRVCTRLEEIKDFKKGVFELWESDGGITIMKLPSGNAGIYLVDIKTCDLASENDKEEYYFD